MDLSGFRRGLAHQRAWWEGAGRSPLNASIARALERDLSAGRPTWLDRAFACWEGRSFRTWYEAPSLILDALHYAALLGEEPGLRDLFPTCGGAGAGADARALGFLGSAPVSFWERLASLRLQTNDPSRSQGWILAACAAFRTRETPFHLVDLGTSAGLNLIGDYLPRSWRLAGADGGDAADPPGWRDRPQPVLSRLGLDGTPRVLAKDEDRLWLKACIPADDAERHARFDEAVRLFRALERESSGPRLEACPFERMPEAAAGRLKPHPEEGLLLYNSQAADFLDDAAYEALKASAAAALAPWEDRGFWVELEMPRDGSDDRHRLTAHRLVGGRLEERIVAEVVPGGLRLLPGWDFFRPLKPVASPRNTREEPAKQLEPGLVKFPFTPGGKS